MEQKTEREPTQTETAITQSDTRTHNYKERADSIQNYMSTHESCHGLCQQDSTNVYYCQINVSHKPSLADVATE